MRCKLYNAVQVRDLQNSPALLAAVSRVAGEQLVPTHHINAAPQVNFSIPGK